MFSCEQSHISALIHARVVGSRVDVVTLWDEIVRVARFSCRFFTAMAGNKAKKRNQSSSMYFYALIWWKRCAFQGREFLYFRLWINKIRSPASYNYTRIKFLCLFCREKFCKKTVYSGIELVCELAKIWLIITKTCFDSFLLFLLVWLLCKSFWKASARTFKSESVFSDCQQIVKKICFVVFCAEILQQFSPTFAKRLLTSCVFLSRSETLHCENKIDMEFWLNRNFY